MKSKLSWITFVPLTILALAIKYSQIFYTGEGQTLFGITSFQLSYIAVGAVVLIMLFTILFTLLDKKIAPYYDGKRNAAAGIIALLIAVVMACDGANRVFNIVQLGTAEILPLIDAVLILVAAVVFVVVGLSRFTGSGAGNGLALFYLVPALWCAVKLIRTFLEFTTVSIYTVDITRLVTYVFLTLFLFNYAVLISKIQGKSPVKLTMIYAFPACAALLMCSIYEIVSIFATGVAFDFFANAESIELLLFGLFVLVFLIELTVRVKTKEEVELIEDDGQSDESEDLEIEEFDKSFADQVITGLDQDTADNAPVHSYFETQDTSDFIYQVTPLSDESNKTSVRYGNIDYNEIDDYITSIDSEYDKRTNVSDEIPSIQIKQKAKPAVKKAEAENTPSDKSSGQQPVQAEVSKPVEEVVSKQKPADDDPASRMDEIDRLIAEISDK